MKRSICFFLACLMLVGCAFAVSCGKKPQTPSETTEPTGTADQNPDFTVPEKLNFDRTFTILTYNSSEPEFGDPEGDGADSVNTALVNRDRFVESYLGVTVKTASKNGQYTDRLSYADYVANSVSSGLAAYDLIGSYSLIPVSLMVRGILEDLNALKYLDFGKDWWADFIYDSVSINNRAYFMSGDISVNLLYFMQIMAFHGDLLAVYNISEKELYDLVDAGEWTLDRLLEITSDISQADSDGKWTEGAFYGVSCVDGNMLDSFYITSGQKLFEIEEGHLTTSKDITSAKTVGLYEKVYKAIYDDHIISYGANAGVTNYMFKNNKSVFGVMTVYNLKGIVDDAKDVGLLPFPKYIEDERYRTLLGSPHTQYFIPFDANKVDESAAVMETMAYASNLFVTPEVFQKVMKYRFSKDPNSSRMFDIIRSGSCTELGILGYMLFTNGIEPASMFRNALLLKKTSWSTYVEGGFQDPMNGVAGALDDFFFD